MSLSQRLLASLTVLLVLAPALFPKTAVAHGSVSAEEDLCAIKIGYFKAHFKIYVPQESGRDDYCEDIPAVGESVFIMEYLHSGLGEIPVDFRIIRDVTGMGTFARWEDVQAIDDLDAVTVFYQPPAVIPDVFTVMYNFDNEPGDYIGIVTAMPPDRSEAYTAVFPFEVGFTGFGYWPVIVFLVAALQFQLLVYERPTVASTSRGATDGCSGEPVVISTLTHSTWRWIVLLAAAAALIRPADAEEEVLSREGLYRLAFMPELQPVVINRLHRWTLQLTDKEGQARR